MEKRIIIRGFANRTEVVATTTSLPSPIKPIGFEYSNRDICDNEVGELSGLDMDIAHTSFIYSHKKS